MKFYSAASIATAASIASAEQYVATQWLTAEKVLTTNDNLCPTEGLKNCASFEELTEALSVLSKKCEYVWGPTVSATEPTVLANGDDYVLAVDFSGLEFPAATSTLSNIALTFEDNAACKFDALTVSTFAGVPTDTNDLLVSESLTAIENITPSKNLVVTLPTGTEMKQTLVVTIPAMVAGAPCVAITSKPASSLQVLANGTAVAGLENFTWTESVATNVYALESECARVGANLPTFQTSATFGEISTARPDCTFVWEHPITNEGVDGSIVKTDSSMYLAFDVASYTDKLPENVQVSFDRFELAGLSEGCDFASAVVHMAEAYPLTLSETADLTDVSKNFTVQLATDATNVPRLTVRPIGNTMPQNNATYIVQVPALQDKICEVVSTPLNTAHVKSVAFTDSEPAGNSATSKIACLGLVTSLLVAAF